MKFQFTGTCEEVFPTIITDAGVLVCQPGDIVDLASDPNHDRLIPVKLKTTKE